MAKLKWNNLNSVRSARFNLLLQQFCQNPNRSRRHMGWRKYLPIWLCLYLRLLVYQSFLVECLQKIWGSRLQHLFIVLTIESRPVFPRFLLQLRRTPHLNYRVFPLELKDMGQKLYKVMLLQKYWQPPLRIFFKIPALDLKKKKKLFYLVRSCL